MKKRTVLVLIIFVFSFILSGCNNNKKDSNTISEGELSKDKVYKVDNWCEYSFMDIKADTRIEPSMPGEYFSYYEITEEGKVYLATTLEIKNTGKNVQTVDNFLQLGYSLGEESFGAFAAVETVDGGNFEYANMIKLEPKSKATVVYLAQVPQEKAKGDVNIKMNIKGALYENTFNIEKVKEKREYKNIGDKIDRTGYAEILIDSLEYKDKVEPSKPGEDYKCYTIDNEEEIYLVLSSKIKNMQDREIKGDRLMSAAIYLNDVKYQPSIIAETEDGSNLTYGKEMPLKENTEGKILYVFKVPKSCQEAKPEIVLNVYGEKYYIKVLD